LTLCKESVVCYPKIAQIFQYLTRTNLENILKQYDYLRNVVESSSTRVGDTSTSTSGTEILRTELGTGTGIGTGSGTERDCDNKQQGNKTKWQRQIS
jgi:hypothetical protein